ncbi:hypothetical protein [Herbaspirillum sp. 1130]|uniref:hypothetical protein n=1 Tax=Herbaspirillum sp. 1130 TaxID=2806562 RepID=UPI001AEAA4C2|nr:hypothetical protein [Herbaspirillum sp. 1130]MBP1317113.1 hypothetical protein [Herbaspirillum sp. 1130]
MDLQIRLGLGSKWGEITIPEPWRPKGRSPSSFRINLYVYLAKHSRDAVMTNQAVLVAMRMVLVCFCAPANMKQGYMMPATIICILRQRWLDMLRLALGKGASRSVGLFETLSRSDFPSNSQFDLRCRIELQRFSRLASMGYWSEISRAEPSASSTYLSFRGARVLPDSVEEDKFRPLPDQFVHLTGKRSLWIVNNLSEEVIDALEEGLAISRKPSRLHKGGPVSKHEKTVRWNSYLARRVWKTKEVSFLNKIVCKGRTTVKNRFLMWPPRTWTDLRLFLKILEMANCFIMALSTGPRASELLSWTTSSIAEDAEVADEIRGKTWKMVQSVHGIERSWPLPTVSQKAAVNQQRIVRLLAMVLDPDLSHQDVRDRTFPLWVVSFPQGTLTPLVNIGPELRWYVNAIGTMHLLDSQALTNHRFRKTIARLIAIAFVHSPRILIDIFGHSSIDMTISYIMTDPQIVADIREARSAIVKMMAKEAIRCADEMGGPAAGRFRETVRIARTMGDFSAESEDDLASMLTEAGRTWLKPRDGVICTKGRGVSGPCALGSKRVNTANCQVNCNHRLEEPTARAQANSAVIRCIEKVELADASGDLIQADIWERRLVENLRRFDSLVDSWQGHPTVDAACQKHQRGAA